MLSHSDLGGAALVLLWPGKVLPAHHLTRVYFGPVWEYYFMLLES